MCIKDNDEDQTKYYTHLLIELYCSYGWNKNKDISIPEFCKSGIGNPGYNCMQYNCPFKSFTYADNEICYAGKLGEVPSSKSWIGFGGDMESQNYDEDENKKLLSLWEVICRKKINEAYEEFMKLKEDK